MNVQPTVRLVDPGELPPPPLPVVPPLLPDMDIASLPLTCSDSLLNIRTQFKCSSMSVDGLDLGDAFVDGE